MEIQRVTAVGTYIMVPLIDASARPSYRASPTLAAGDVLVIRHTGGAWNASNITNLPATAGTTKQVLVQLTATEMTSDNLEYPIVVQFVDQTATKEWDDQEIVIWTKPNAVNAVQVGGDALGTHGTGYFPADCRQWVGGTIAPPDLTGKPDVNLKAIDGQLTNGNNATLYLKQLSIVNATGDAIIATASGANGRGIVCTGNGTGNGFSAYGGATSGSGMGVYGGGTGAGLWAIGGSGATGNGISCTSQATNGHGFACYGNGTGHGALCTGGGSSGDGIHANATGGNGTGIYGGGYGTGHGLQGAGGANGNGLHCTGGATAGSGIYAYASGAGSAVTILAAATAGHALAITAQGTSASAIYAIAATTADAAVFNASGSQPASAGIAMRLLGTGDALNAVAGGTGHGICAKGGTSGFGGSGIYAEAGGTIANGIYGIGKGTGSGMRLDGGNSYGNGLFCVATSNGSGAYFAGQGTGHGLRLSGDAGNALYGQSSSAEAIFFQTAATSADVVRLYHNGASGNGIAITAAGSGSGILTTGGATGHGFKAVGGGTSGNGIHATAVGGDAMYLFASGGGWNGLNTIGNGVGHGISANGGATSGMGLFAVGGGTGHGVLAQSGAGATGDGFRAVAASTAGRGMYLKATAAQDGLYAEGGASGGSGFRLQGGANGGHGMYAGGGATAGYTEAGIYCQGGGVGAGLYAQGGSGYGTNGIHAVAVAAGGNGLFTLKGSGGYDIKADELQGIKTITDQFRFTVANKVDATASFASTPDVNVINWKGATAPAMTGDAFARLGAPAGASIAADIAAVPAGVWGYGSGRAITDKAGFTLTSAYDNAKTAAQASALATTDGKVDAIKTKTDQLIFTGAYLNSQVKAMDTDSISAAAISAAAVTKIQTGLGSGADVTAIKAQTDKLNFTGANIQAIVQAMATDSISAAAVSAAAVTKVQTGLATSADVVGMNVKLDAIYVAEGETQYQLSIVDGNVAGIVAVLPTSGRISNFALTDTVDGIPVSQAFELALCMVNGRFRKDYPNTGDLTFYKRDNVTVLFTAHVTETERTRT